MFWKNLKIANQSSVAHQPPKSSFNNPAFRHNLETFRGITAFDDFEFNLAVTRKTRDILDQLSRISSVGPDPLQPSESANQNSAQQVTRSIPILDGRLGDGDPQQESVGVYQHVSFPSNHLFARIIATYSGLASCSNALAVEDRSGRGFFLPLSERARSRNASWTFCQIPSFAHSLK
jgi:hypothetical protein